jgi:alpha-galactosidase
MPKSWADIEHPILLNSWEAKYFDVNHENIVDMAIQVDALQSKSFHWLYGNAEL